MTNTLHLPTTPTSVTIEIVRGCNLACKMCLGSHSDRPRHADHCFIAKVIEQVRTLDLKWLRFCGDGEPTLHPELADFVRLARDAGVPIVGFVTNGTLLGSPLVDRLHDAGLNFLTVSLDAATEETYTRIRRGKVPLSTVENNLRRILALRARTGWPIEVQVNFVVQPDNVAEVDLFVARWCGEVDRVNLLRRTTFDGMRDPAKGPCYMARSKLYVSVDGDIYPCFHLYPPVQPIGTLSTDTIGEVWLRRRRVVEAKPEAAATALCNRCTYSEEPWTDRP